MLPNPGLLGDRSCWSILSTNAAHGQSSSVFLQGVSSLVASLCSFFHSQKGPKAFLDTSSREGSGRNSWQAWRPLWSPHTLPCPHGLLGDGTTSNTKQKEGDGSSCPSVQLVPLQVPGTPSTPDRSQTGYICLPTEGRQTPAQMHLAVHEPRGQELLQGRPSCRHPPPPSRTPRAAPWPWGESLLQAVICMLGPLGDEGSARTSTKTKRNAPDKGILPHKTRRSKSQAAQASHKPSTGQQGPGPQGSPVTHVHQRQPKPPGRETCRAGAEGPQFSLGPAAAPHD